MIHPDMMFTLSRTNALRQEEKEQLLQLFSWDGRRYVQLSDQLSQ